jgi:calcineurin-like phosphoesterase family protein
MSKIWFTSDTHFGHKNIITYSNRPFKSVEHMDESMMARWNKKVAPEDEVWHLGDFAFHKEAKVESILRRLNGHKHFIRGNHDEIMPNLYKYFESVQDYKELRIEGQKIVLMHFPLLTWNKGHRGAWHLHGHCHGSINHLNEGITRIDVGVDNFDYAPVSYEELHRMLKGRKYLPVDHHIPKEMGGGK